MSADRHQSTRPAGKRFCVPLFVWGCLCWLTSGLPAEDFIEGFEGDTPAWRFLRHSSQAKVLQQVCSTDNARTGQKSESLVIETFPNDQPVELIYKLPAAVRFDELKSSVWVWSDHPGIQAVVRVQLPNQIDPRTGQALVFSVFGDIHGGGGQWQRLEIDLSDRAYKETMRRVRSDLSRRVGSNKLNEQGAFVDQMSLHLATVQKVRWNIRIDDLELSPVVPPQANSQSEGESTQRIPPRVRIGDDRVLLDGQPFFPLIIPYHGESTETLAHSNVNVIWVPDYTDRALLDQLSDAGLGVMATPPQPDFETATPDMVGLLPFNSSTDPILLWMLDVQIPSSRLQQASAWAEMVRDADRQRSRPIMADVMGKEREFHRELSLVGASRAILHTSKTPQIYAATLEHRQRMALPGKPIFTLITTEPAEELLASRPARSTAPIVEPEQIWMQTNIALAAGYKGIGYLSFHSLESTEPGTEERRLAIELANYQIRLLEPWLATAKVLQQARVQVAQDKKSSQRSPLLSRWDVRPGSDDLSPAGIAARQIQATVLECDQGLMVLVNWLEDNAQYQPGRMCAKDVRILVNRDVVQACEMTTTGLHLHTLGLTRVAGGTEVLIKDLNQSTVILIANDNQAKDALNSQIARVRPMVSEAWSNLARAKLERVRDVHHQLVQLAPPVTNAEPVLREASQLADQAQKAHESGRFGEVERLARSSMAYLRDLQQTHWKIATGRETSPAASPHTICFQTLPDHWRMKETLKKSTHVSDNLLKSGNFDDTDAVFVSWTKTSDLPENAPISATALLVGPPENSCLQLNAVMARGRTIAGTLEQSPVTLASPAFTVSAGDIIRVQGRIQIRKPLESTTDGLLIYDSLVGTTGALRFTEPTAHGSGSWQDFEFYREVAHSGEMRIFFELRGLGNVWLDDLRVTATQVDGPEKSPNNEPPEPRRLPTNEGK